MLLTQKVEGDSTCQCVRCWLYTVHAICSNFSSLNNITRGPVSKMRKWDEMSKGEANGISKTNPIKSNQTNQTHQRFPLQETSVTFSAAPWLSFCNQRGLRPGKRWNSRPWIVRLEPRSRDTQRGRNGQQLPLLVAIRPWEVTVTEQKIQKIEKIGIWDELNIA